MKILKIFWLSIMVSAFLMWVILFFKMVIYNAGILVYEPANWIRYGEFITIIFGLVLTFFYFPLTIRKLAK